jgi:hypothetical protein
MSKTTTELEGLIAKGHAANCVAFFKGMDESARRTFAKTSEDAFKASRKTPILESVPGRFEWNPKLGAATVAVFSCCSFSTLKSLGPMAIPADEQLIEILSDRRPEWCDAFAEFLLDRDHPRWTAVRALMRAGLCCKPQHDSYLIAMLHHSMGVGDFRHGRVAPEFRSEQFRGVLEHLLEEPDLLDDVWRLFEVEGGGQYSLAAHDKYSAAGNASWNGALVELSRRGVLPRDRLLDASLAALDRGFAQFRVGWFSTFHEMLEPTITERTTRADQYLNLLASPIPPTATFALKAVDLIDRQTSFDTNRLIEALRPLLISRAKATVKAALKILDRVARRDREAAAAASLAAVQSLAHEAHDVQSAAFVFLEKHGSAECEELRDAISRTAESVAASLKSRLAGWLKMPFGPKSEPIAPPYSDQAGGHATLRARAARIPEQWRKLAGVDLALESLALDKLDLAACPFDGSEIPRLDLHRTIVPLKTLDDLIDAAAAALESRDDYDAFERVLDGVSRLCDQRPADFEQRMGPVRNRCKQLLSRTEQLPFYGNDPHFHLIGVVLAWVSRDCGSFRAVKWHNHPAVEYRIDGELHQGFAESVKHPTDPLGIRAMRLAERAARAESAVLLSAPTHHGGWVHSAVLAERVRAQDEKFAEDFDSVLALLRLAPEGRSQALEIINNVRGEFASACRYALGDSAAPQAEPVWLWVAASRARSPWQTDHRLVSLVKSAGPDAAEQVDVDFKIGDVKKFSPLKLQVRPALPRELDPRLLTVRLWRHAVHGSGERFEAEQAARIRGAQSVWPTAMEAVCAAGARKIAENLDWWSANWGHRTYFEPLLDADLPLREMARLLLVLGLAAKEPGERGLATDVCIAAIGDRRLDGDQLGKTMSRLWPSGLITLTRWADSLGQAARPSALHAETVRCALDLALAATPKKLPGDLHALLGLLLELVHETGTPISSTTRTVLARFGGSNKASRIAKELVERSGASSASRIAEIMHADAEARIIRAERWHARQTLR